jgi:hypothetical protein
MKSIIIIAALLAFVTPTSVVAKDDIPTNTYDCLAVSQTLERNAERRAKLIPFRRVPRDIWRVLASIDGFCLEEDFEKAQISIDWMRTCLKEIRNYAKSNKLSGPCVRDKKYFCAVLPQSDACLQGGKVH